MRHRSVILAALGFAMLLGASAPAFAWGGGHGGGWHGGGWHDGGWHDGGWRAGWRGPGWGWHGRYWGPGFVVGVPGYYPYPAPGVVLRIP